MWGLDSRHRGNDDVGAPPVVPVETGTHPHSLPWFPAIEGMTEVRHFGRWGSTSTRFPN